MTTLITGLLAFALVPLPAGDSNLLRFRLPGVKVSALELDVLQYSSWGLIPGANVGAWIIPAYRALIIGEQLNLDARAEVELQAYPLTTDLWFQGSSYGEQSYSARPQLSASADWYPGILPLGVGAEGDLDGAFGWWRCAYDSTPPTEALLARSSRSLAGSAVVGPVAGRLRDARTVIQALRIQELLESAGALLREFNSEDVQAVAEQLAREPEFDYHYRLPNREVFQALESVLRGRGLIARKVPARVWLAIRDALTIARTIERPVGAKLSTRAGLDASAYFTSETMPDSTITTASRRLGPNVIVQLDAGYPLSRRWQTAANAGWRVRTDTAGPLHLLEAGIGLSYHWFDRLLITAGYAVSWQNRVYGYGWEGQGVGEQRYRLDHGPDFAVSYYVEDNLSLDATAGVSWASYRDGTASGTPVTGNGLNFSIGLHHRLALP